MYKPKKNPVIPRLQNLGSINEYGPLSCRSNTKNTNFIQTCQTTRNAKENTIKIPLKQSKSPNASIHKKAPTQTAQVLKVLNSNVATPEKVDEQDLYYQIIKQRTQQKHTFCSLHTTKKAKFFIHPNNRVLLCSLCAIQEAYDGKAIIWSLDTNEQIPKRLQEDEWTIINSYPASSERYKKVEQLQSLLNTAKQLYQQVKALKETSIGNINVCDILEEVQQISKDIITNVNNIVEHLDSRPFQLILQKYIQRLQHYEKIIPKHKQIYISFSNKETFQSADSIALRQSETHRFINDFNSLYSPNF